MKSLFEEIFGGLWPLGSGYNYETKRKEILVDNEAKNDQSKDTWEMRFPQVKKEDDGHFEVRIRKNYLVQVCCSREDDYGFSKYEATRTIPDFVDPATAVAELGDDGLTITFKKKVPEAPGTEPTKKQVEIKIEDGEEE